MMRFGMQAQPHPSQLLSLRERRERVNQPAKMGVALALIETYVTIAQVLLMRSIGYGSVFSTLE
jgi:hypothetical protein